MKKVYLFVCVYFVLNSIQAQKKQNVYFFKNNGKEVQLKDSADFIRIIQEPDSGETDFVFQEFYANGKRKTAGKVSSFDPRLVFEGVVVKYNPAGRRVDVATYKNGMPLGMAYRYFENGKIHKQIEYLAFNPNPPTSAIFPPESAIFNPHVKLIYLVDSLGVELVKDGNGHVIEMNGTGKGQTIEEGDYKEGVKHGVWKGSGMQQGSSFVETYEMGKSMGGESNIDGVQYKYVTAFDAPQYKGGIQKFYEYISHTMKYPADAVKERATGTVYLEFTIEKDGSITEVKVKRAVHPSLDYEAQRVVRFSPKWIPGKIRGVPMRVRYNIPIKFSIPF